MKRGSDLGMIPVKTKNKEGTDDLKQLHYAINDLMFEYNKRYISRLDAKSIVAQLMEFGEALKELKLPSKAVPKKDEILNYIRKTYSSVNQYNKVFV